MEKPAFAALMAATIRQNYSGNPLALAPFLASIDFLKEMAETPTLLTLLKKFILTKLEGYASEIVPANVESIDALVKCLRDKIKHDNSKVIEARMLALRCDYRNLQSYAKEVENLADAFRRALIYEQMPHEMAEKIVIEKTVELCRANTQNGTVKAILASKKFENPKEVVAQFVIESTKQEAQIMSLRKFENMNLNGNSTQGGNANRINNCHQEFFNNGTNRNEYNINAYHMEEFSNGNQDEWDEFDNENEYDDDSEANEIMYENEENICDESQNDQPGSDATGYNECEEEQAACIFNISVQGGYSAKDFINFKTSVSRDIVSALVDSQGDICLIKYNSLMGSVKINWKKRRNIVGITQNILTTYGVVWLDVNVGKVKISHPFHVVPANFPIPTNGLLGKDFLHLYKCKLDFATQKLTICTDKANIEVHMHSTTDATKMYNSEVSRAHNNNKLCMKYENRRVKLDKKPLSKDFVINDSNKSENKQPRPASYEIGKRNIHVQTNKNSTNSNIKNRSTEPSHESKQCFQNNPWFRKKKYSICQNRVDNNKNEANEYELWLRKRYLRSKLYEKKLNKSNDELCRSIVNLAHLNENILNKRQSI